jgi:hypothetical protein
MAQAGAGLLEAGVSIVLSVVGAKGGAAAVSRTATKNAVKQAASLATKGFALKGGKAISKQAGESLAKSVTSKLTGVSIGAADFLMFVKPAKKEAEAIAIAQAAGMTKRAATQFVAQCSRNMAPVMAAQARGGMVAGVVAGIGSGLFTSMYLHGVLANTFAGALVFGDSIFFATATFLTSTFLGAGEAFLGAGAAFLATTFLGAITFFTTLFFEGATFFTAAFFAGANFFTTTFLAAAAFLASS